MGFTWAFLSILKHVYEQVHPDLNPTSIPHDNIMYVGLNYSLNGTLVFECCVVRLVLRKGTQHDMCSKKLARLPTQILLSTLKSIVNTLGGNLGIHMKNQRTCIFDIITAKSREGCF
jgi:hypothetical protein